MRFIYLLAATMIVTLAGHAPLGAGSHAYYCADASTQFQYDGQKLTWRDFDKPQVAKPLASREISKTLIASDEETCTNKKGREFVSASKAYLVVLEFANPWSKKLVQRQFLCSEDFDSYPNMQGVDTKCAKTVTKTGRLQKATLATRTTTK